MKCAFKRELDVRDYKHIADSFDNAMKIGMEGLRNLSGEEC